MIMVYRNYFKEYKTYTVLMNSKRPYVTAIMSTNEIIELPILNNNFYLLINYCSSYKALAFKYLALDPSG